MTRTRTSPRAHVSLVARYRSPTVFEFVDEQCFDLSRGGMFIKSLHPSPIGTLLKIECEVDQGPRKINAVARVVWTRVADQPNAPSGMGVKFVKLDSESASLIEEIVSKAGPQSDSERPEFRSSNAPGPAGEGQTPSPRFSSTPPIIGPLSSTPPQPVELVAEPSAAPEVKAAVARAQEAVTPTEAAPPAQKSGTAPSPLTESKTAQEPPLYASVSDKDEKKVEIIASTARLATQSRRREAEPPRNQMNIALAATALVVAIGFLGVLSLQNNKGSKPIEKTVTKSPAKGPVPAQEAVNTASKPQPPASSAPAATMVEQAAPPTATPSPEESAPKVKPKVREELPSAPAAVEADTTRSRREKRAKKEDEKERKPLDIANECLIAGDNQCAIRALEGKANTSAELSMLIESYRAVGDLEPAYKHMARYVKKFPTARRAAIYRTILDLRAR